MMKSHCYAIPVDQLGTTPEADVVREGQILCCDLGTRCEVFGRMRSLVTANA